MATWGNRAKARPPAGELTEAAYYLASRPGFAMRCGSSQSGSGLRADPSGSSTCEGKSSSERQQHVHHLLPIARLLHIRNLAAAAIGDAGLRDLAGVDRVVALDVLRPHNPGDDQFADLKIDRSEEHTSELQSPYDLV